MQKETNLELVRQHVSVANGLPNEHYIDQSVFDEERNSVLFNQWAGLDVCSEVPEIGDSKPINFMGLPLFIIRDTKNIVRVFQNTCRHRGMILVEKTKKIHGAIRCPYHSWCYSTEGKLVSTPHVGGPGQNTDENIDRTKLSLVEIRSHVWRDVIWVNIDGTAEPFEEVMASTIDRWKELDQKLYHGGEDGKFSLKVKGNWKLAVENYCESYHLPWVHPGLNSYSRLEDHYHIVKYGSHSGQGSLVYRQLTDDKGQKFPDFKNLSKKWSTGAEYIALYPNVLLGAHRDHAYAIILLPLSYSETIENVHIYYSQPNTSSSLKKKIKISGKKFSKKIFLLLKACKPVALESSSTAVAFHQKWTNLPIVSMIGLQVKLTTLEIQITKLLMSLNNKILKAHHNKNLSLLVELYQEAADKVSTRQEQNFFRVQAYVYALEVGHHLTPILHKKLVKDGVEE